MSKNRNVALASDMTFTKDKLIKAIREIDLATKLKYCVVMDHMLDDRVVLLPCGIALIPESFEENLVDAIGNKLIKLTDEEYSKHVDKALKLMFYDNENFEVLF